MTISYLAGILLILMSLLTLIPGSLSYADIDLSRATNLAPEEKYDIMAQAEASKKSPDKAYLLIYSDVGWSATVLDSGRDSFVQDGSKNSKIEFECVPAFTNMYSLNVQKKSEAGNLLLITVQNGNLLDAMNTQATYGIASLSGKCGEPEDIDMNDLKGPTLEQRKKEEAARRVVEEEAQRLKEAGFRQTDNSEIIKLMNIGCTSIQLNSFNQTVVWNCPNGTVSTP
jgi:hypothetical protein